MSLFRRSGISIEEAAREYGRPLRSHTPFVSSRSALQQSVVWGATRLRADLVSVMPVDVYRTSAAAGIAVEVTPPPVLVEPSDIAEGQPMPINEWMYSSQMSLDRVGNQIGFITQTNALGLPAAIDLIPDDMVSMRIKDRRIVEYRINGEKVPPRNIWHERQFTVAGLPIGLSPIAHAALQLTGASLAQEWAVDWFVNGAVPGSILKNDDKILKPEEAERTRRRFKASIANGDVFVTGKDWTYSAVAATAAQSSFIEQMKYSDVALCRFFGVPADLVDVVADQSTTYANISQRNLQLLIMHLDPSLTRREKALSRLTPKPQYVKLNRDKLLAMDPASRASLFAQQITSRTRTPDQARALDDLPPLTEADYEQFERLFPSNRPTAPQTSGGN